MSVRIDTSAIDRMISSKVIERDIAETLEEKIVDAFTDLTAPSPLGCPVDSGAARNSIKLDLSNPLNPAIYSDCVYMPALENGHSQKTPAGFWARAADKHLR